MNSVQEYIESLPEKRKERILQIRNLILSLYPEIEENMKYRMPTYTTSTGWVSVASQKSYISLYTCNASHIKRFKERYPEIKTGKGCINFRDNDSFPLEEIGEVLKKAVGKYTNKEGEKNEADYRE